MRKKNDKLFVKLEKEITQQSHKKEKCEKNEILLASCLLYTENIAIFSSIDQI